MRVLSASHKNLAALVRDGSFRQDLFYRLNVIEMRLPSLREHPDDIPELVEAIIGRLSRQTGLPKPRMTPSALAALRAYAFPGNIRELENMIERAIVVGNGKKITLKDLPIASDAVASPETESLEEAEKNFIRQILEKYSWNISRSAKALKVDRVTLYNKIRKYGLKPAD